LIQRWLSAQARHYAKKKAAALNLIARRSVQLPRMLISGGKQRLDSVCIKRVTGITELAVNFYTTALFL
tara:strand:- start:21 stop:227 length:207 start_codon:yes stop_codon:yes gene_type:complete